MCAECFYAPECYACVVGVATGPESHSPCCPARGIPMPVQDGSFGPEWDKWESAAKGAREKHGEALTIADGVPFAAHMLVEAIKFIDGHQARCGKFYDLKGVSDDLRAALTALPSPESLSRDLRAAVLAIHFRQGDTPDGVDDCAECYTSWPCSTAQAVGAVEQGS